MANSARPPSQLIPVGDQKTDALFTELADHEPNTRWAKALVDTAAAIPRILNALLNALPRVPHEDVRRLADSARQA